MSDNYFSCDAAVVCRNDEEIDSGDIVRDLVREGVAIGKVLEAVDECTVHVVHFDVGLADDSSKLQGHFSLVGIGCDREVGNGGGLVKAIE